MKFIATLAEENGQLIEYRTSPFIFNGLTSPRPLIMGKGKTNKEVVNEACALKAEKACTDSSKVKEAMENS